MEPHGEDLGMRPEPKSLFSGRVVLADKDQQMRELIGIMLLDLGFDVVTAVDGIEAIVHFLEDPENVRMMVLDLSMPRMDGLRAFQTLRKLNPDLPIIISSGRPPDEIPQTLKQEKRVAILAKPQGFKNLSETVQTVLC